jgi:hypothetical protein
MGKRLRGVHPGGAQCGETVGFRGKGVGVFGFIRLQKAGSRADGYAVTVVDAAAANGLCGGNRKKALQLRVH